MHVSRRYGTYETAVLLDSYRKRDEDGPTGHGSPNGDETILRRRVLGIRSNAETVSEKGLDLCDRKAMFLTLRPVPFISIEPADSQIHHHATYTNVYT